jgi:hypothetical protein
LNIDNITKIKQLYYLIVEEVSAMTYETYASLRFEFEFVCFNDVDFLSKAEEKIRRKKN